MAPLERLYSLSRGEDANSQLLVAVDVAEMAERCSLGEQTTIMSPNCVVVLK